MRLGVGAGRAYFGRLFALMEVAAISASPDDFLILFEDRTRFDNGYLPVRPGLDRLLISVEYAVAGDIESGVDTKYSHNVHKYDAYAAIST